MKATIEPDYIRGVPSGGSVMARAGKRMYTCTIIMSHRIYTTVPHAKARVVKQWKTERGAPLAGLVSCAGKLEGGRVASFAEFC